MKAKMQVKVLMGSDAAAIESQINQWLDQLDGVIIKTETHAAAIAEKPGGATHPWIVTTIWYEPRTD